MAGGPSFDDPQAALPVEFSAERSSDDPALVIDVDGFEGPLDLLLTLARSQKVDLTRISILALAEQYLTFIEEAQKLRLDIAADYLVMAAWLAYLKSRLLLPVQEDEDEPSASKMIERLVEGQETVVRTARQIFPLVEAASDEPTADLLTQRMQVHEKNAWMLRSLLDEAT